LTSVVELSVCSTCGGTGWESLDTGARPCECSRLRRIEKALAESRVPERYLSKDFDNYETYTPAFHAALMKTRSFVAEMPATSEGLMYVGTVGTGKTHLACAALKLLIEKGLVGYFYEFRDLLTMIRNSYNAATQATELQVLKPVLTADVLVLDELGAAKPTDWVQETVTYIVNERYNAKRATIFTSNYPDVAAGPYDETLTDRVGIRLRSRLREMCRLVLIDGPDYRERIRNRSYVGTRSA